MRASTGRLSNAPNVHEHCVGAGPNSPLSMWVLPEIAPLTGCDVFHATANILPARLPMKTVTSVHDIMWLDHPQWCDTSLAAPLKRAFYAHGIRRALSHSDRIAAISRATADAILAHHPESAERLSVTLPGVSDRFKPAPRDPAQMVRLGLDDGATYGLVVGQNAPYKNHEGALRGFALAREMARNAREGLSQAAPDGAVDTAKLVFVHRQGQGPAELRALAHELGIDDAVIFTGPLDEAGLIQLYCGAHVLLHPSWCEGFGNPVAEAMACGCPVITSARSAMPEVAGGAALLVDPADCAHIARALCSVWADPAQRDAMSQAGIARAKTLKWADFAAANIAIYRALIASK